MKTILSVFLITGLCFGQFQSKILGLNTLVSHTSEGVLNLWGKPDSVRYTSYAFFSTQYSSKKKDSTFFYPEYSFTFLMDTLKSIEIKKGTSGLFKIGMSLNQAIDTLCVYDCDGKKCDSTIRAEFKSKFGYKTFEMYLVYYREILYFKKEYLESILYLFGD